MTLVRPRVLFLIPALLGGGAERVFSTLLRHIDRERFELHLALLHADGPYLRDIPADVVVHNLRVSRIRYALPAVIRVVRAIQPDTVLSTLTYMNLVALVAKPFMPTSTRLLIREAAVASAFLEMEVRLPAIWKAFYRHLYRRAEKVICLSDAIVRDFQEEFGLPAEKLVRIYNPVDIKRVRESAVLEPNPYAGRGPHLVAAGRLCRQKGFDVLLDAMPKVRAKMPDARVAILGEGELGPDLKAQTARLQVEGAVDFLGFKQNPWPYFRHANLLVLPSRYEGLPNVVLEALSLGTPVVATDCPGGSREIQSFDDRVTLVPPDDSGALADAILFACKRTRMPLPGDDPTLRGFDLETTVEEYSRLLDRRVGAAVQRA